MGRYAAYPQCPDPPKGGNSEHTLISTVTMTDKYKRFLADAETMHSKEHRRLSIEELEGVVAPIAAEYGVD
jgi:hypothetical protein